MKLIILIIVSSILFGSDLYSSDIESESKHNNGMFFVFLGTGIGFHDFTILKDFNESHLETTPFPDKLVDNFPITPIYMLKFNILKSQNNFLTLNMAYNSTGSRTHYQDYSGEYANEMIVNSSSIGTEFTTFIYNYENKLKFGFCAGIGWSSKVLKQKILLRVAEDSILERDQLSEEYYYIQPGVNLSYIYNSLLFQLIGNYKFDLDSGNSSFMDHSGFGVSFFVGLNTNIFR